MTCQETKSLFVRYLDDDLGLEDRLAVDRHTASCYECHEDLRDLRVLLAAAHEALTPPPATHRFEDLVPLLHSEPPVPVKPTSVWRDLSRLVAAAAVVIVLLAAVDMALDGIHQASIIVERAITEEPTPSESAKGLMGWRKRIAWAESQQVLSRQNASQAKPDTTPKAAPENPNQKPENTTWRPGVHRGLWLKYAAAFDRNHIRTPLHG